MAHTKGPWRAVPIEEHDAYGTTFARIAIMQRGDYDMTVATIICDLASDEVEANAALIASSPDLAARVEELEKALEQALGVIDLLEDGALVLLPFEDDHMEEQDFRDEIELEFDMSLIPEKDGEADLSAFVYLHSDPEPQILLRPELAKYIRERAAAATSRKEEEA